MAEEKSAVITKREILVDQDLAESVSDDFLVPAFTDAEKWQYRSFCFLWAVALADFWLWWFEPRHNISGFWFYINTAVLFWLTVAPNYFLLMFARGRVVSPARALPASYRVAMIVTKASSEPFDVVRCTLLAMLAQAQPHDTWLADEDPSQQTIDWCATHGVRISTRRDCADYHRAEWPRRTRCKEGNLAYFYDHFGYAMYDIVVQMDADHVPDENYLTEILRPFLDPSVGYVSAPSICDRNAAESWAARSRLYVEGSFHGALQVGYTGGFAPLCIGSHYAVRTTALREIGGLGPELAEDHSTSLMMNAHGWRGVHAVNAIAHGDGPVTFADLVTQEFQWSRSLMTILLKHTPQHVDRLLPRVRFQFLFCQLWYPLFSLGMLVTYLLPIAALMSDEPFVDVTYPEFCVRFGILSIILVLMAVWWRRRGWSRPQNAKVLSWEGALFLYCRWPWSLCGVSAGLINWLRGSEVEFRVTPKGKDAARGPLPIRVILPYAVLSAASSICAMLLPTQNAKGFYIFATLNALIYALIVFVILYMHRKETAGKCARDRTGNRAVTTAKGTILAAVVTLAIVGAVVRGPEGLQVLLIGTEGVVTHISAVSVTDGLGTRRRAH
jgi:cellulose synthase/poly-beta-1,6-N-acetylglucosamine synthase-like glycosyltransferase